MDCFFRHEHSVLASIHSREENDFILSQMAGVNLYSHSWIGMYRSNTGWCKVKAITTHLDSNYLRQLNKTCCFDIKENGDVSIFWPTATSGPETLMAYRRLDTTAIKNAVDVTKKYNKKLSIIYIH